MNKNIDKVTKHDLCIGCGICSNICHTKAINIKVINGQYLPCVDNDKCINCGKCLKVCPGLGIDIKEIAEEKFDFEFIKTHKLIGKYYTSYSGFATDYETRYHGASGGLLTAFIAFLLDKGYISAAVVAENDLSKPFFNKTVLIHDSKNLYKTRSSKYCPVMYENIISQVKNEKGKVVIVGVPCVLHGFRKYEKIDKEFRNKIFGLLGLYCSSGRTFSLTEYTLKAHGFNVSSMQYFQYRDNGCLGNLVAKDSSTYKEIPFQLYYHPLRSFFTPMRCQFCIDHYAELADISFGDIHYGRYKEDKIGINSVVIRNEKFDTLIKEAVVADYIKINNLTEEELVKCQAAAIKKKDLVFGMLRFANYIGVKIPIYDEKLPCTSFLKSIVFYLFAKIQNYIGKRKYLWFLISLLSKKSKID